MKPNDKEIRTRSIVGFNPSTLREKDRSVEFVLSTENPVRVWSWDRDIVDEVLVSSGLVLPDNRQVPLLDSHERNTTKSVFGSVREIRIEGDKVIGRLYFARNPDAIEAFEKVRDGHLDSGSVGYKPESEWVHAGDQVDYQGRTYTGPLLLTKKWYLREYSVTAIGADPNAKARSDTDNTVNNSQAAEKINKETKQMDEAENTKRADLLAEAERKVKELEAQAAEKLAVATRKLVDMEISEVCKCHNCEDLAKGMIERKLTKEQALEEILRHLAEIEEKKRITSGASSNAEMGETDGEKKRDEVVIGLMARGLPGSVKEEGRNIYKGMSLLEIGRSCLEREGIRTVGLTKEEIARKIIMSTRNAVAADLTTASFANITEGVVSKAVMRGFESQQHVWDSICSIGSTSDFKAASRLGLSENADLPLKREGAEYVESKFSDRKESGTVATYADKSTLTEEAIINDDVSVLMTIPLRKGGAAMRVPEALLFAAINTPPTLNATSKAWFDTTNTVANDIVEANGLTSTNLSTCRARMRQMPVHKHDSETATDYYDLMPRVLLVHPDYEDTAKILTQSIALPATSMSSGVYNPASDANIMVKSSARITTSTNFYLFADPNLYPVCEMLFLNGRAAPESFLDTSTNIDGLTFRIRIRVGLIVLEWRTAIRHKNT